MQDNIEASPRDKPLVPPEWHPKPHGSQVIRRRDGTQGTECTMQLNPSIQTEPVKQTSGGLEYRQSPAIQQRTDVLQDPANEHNPLRIQPANAPVDDSVQQAGQIQTQQPEAAFQYGNVSAPPNTDILSSQSEEPSSQIAVSAGAREAAHSSSKSEWKRTLTIGSICLIMVLIIVVISIIALTQPVKREEGAWPDFAYLSTFMDDPDKLVCAVNDPELTSAYEQYKANPNDSDGDIEAPIHIADLNEYEGTEDVQVNFRLAMAAPDELLAFGVEYAASPSTNTANMDEWYMDMLSALLLANSRTSKDQAETFTKTISDDAAMMREKYQTYDELVDKTAMYPVWVLNKVGLSLNELQDVQSSYGTASWERAYALAVQDYGIRELNYANHGGSDESPDPFYSGYTTILTGNFEADEAIYTVDVETNSFDSFSFSSLDVENDDPTMTLTTAPNFSVNFAVDRAISSNIEDNLLLSDTNKKIWEFSEGTLPSDALG